INADAACLSVALKYGAIPIACTARAPVNAAVKSVLYSAARFIAAEQFLCLDADMLVLGDLRPLFGALEACAEGTVLACRECNGPTFSNLGQGLGPLYFGSATDLARVTALPNGEGAYPLVVNDGLFAAGRPAMLTLDATIRNWSWAPAWVDEH